MNESKFYIKLGFTDDSAAPFSSIARAVTHGPGHVIAIVLEHKPDGTFSHYYFESIIKTDPQTHKNGVRGPIPYEHVVSWANESNTRYLITVPDDGYLPLTHHEADDAIKKMKAAVNVIYYAPFQLLSNLLAAKIKMRLTFGQGSPKNWTCCELPLRCHVIPPRMWDTLNVLTITADEFWPGGPSQYSLYEGAQRVVEKYGTINPS